MKRNLLVILGLLAILILSACGSTATKEATTTSSTSVSATATMDLSNPTDAQMEAFITEKIHGTHTLEFILAQKLTELEWSDMIDRMIALGTQLTPEEKAAMIKWLVNR